MFRAGQNNADPAGIWKPLVPRSEQRLCRSARAPDPDRFFSRFLGHHLSEIQLFREARRQSQAFHSYFHTTSSLAAIHAECEQFPKSPLAGIFKGAITSCSRRLRPAVGPLPRFGTGAVSSGPMRRAAQIEMTALESSLNWLATTAAVTPFIGLFGTVIGIINAFQGLGEGSTTTIQAVAPGISEALVARPPALRCHPGCDYL